MKLGNLVTSTILLSLASTAGTVGAGAKPHRGPEDAGEVEGIGESHVFGHLVDPQARLIQ